MGLGLSSIKGQERATMEQRMSVGNLFGFPVPFHWRAFNSLC